MKFLTAKNHSLYPKKAPSQTFGSVVNTPLALQNNKPEIGYTKYYKNLESCLISDEGYHYISVQLLYLGLDVLR